MANNQYVNKVIVNNQTIIDLSGDTVDTAHLAAGYTAHNAAGEPITGSAVIPSGSTTIAENGTYNIAQYASVTVALPTYDGSVT